ncbi:hypothetical protein [Actinomadura violacea]|uniref:Uncharacterized protein n=1 Tax=Actinomadura violacea TaxID=2819934 RepID=A0ABS3RTL7_9ACTN|nr:hypothetical protein [Actinomadura violacea]MBO2460007.1 hypothetical protein [Actinomadura violacea]
MIGLLRLELRRNITPFLLPTLAILLWLSPYGRSLTGTAVWTRRGEALQETLLGLGPAMAGAAAWTASRENRARTRELLATTARGGWSRTLPGWAATALWGLALLAAATGVLYGLTARAATWGGPPWWPVAATCAALLAFCSAGHAIGALLPGRFVAPLTAIGTFLLVVVAGALKTADASLGLVSPVGQVTDPYRALYYRAGHDLPVVELIFAAGVIALPLGLLALRGGAGGPLVRPAGIVLTAAGTAVAGTGLWLAGTGHIVANQGIATIPRLESRGDGRPIAYTPACDRTPIQVCVHPAVKARLGAAVAALHPVTDRLAGLPGVPTTIDQRMVDGPSIRGSVLLLPAPFEAYDTRGRIRGRVAREMRADTAAGLLLGAWDGTGSARQAAVLAVLVAAGDPPDGADLPIRDTPGPAVLAAARRLAALPQPAWHQWFAAHLSALRADRLTLKDLP